MNFKKLAITLPAPILIVSLLSLFMTYINHGYHEDFFQLWGHAWVFSILVILPIAGILIMNIGRIVEKRYGHWPLLQQKLLQCAGIAITLEAILAAITTLSTMHASSVAQFLSIWALTLVKALPLGYVIAMTMVFFVKPRIQRALAAL